MLHIKFRENCTAGSGEEDFCIISSDFHFLVPETLHTKFGSDRHSSFLESQV